MVVVGVPSLAIEMWPLSREPRQLLERAYGNILGRDHFSAVWGDLLYPGVGASSAAYRQEQAGAGRAAAGSASH